MKNRNWAQSAAVGAVITMSSIFGQAALAGPICETVEECRAMRDQGDARLQELLKNALPAFGDLVKESDGSIRRMNQYQAEQYCKDNNSRLPSARELALLSQSLGAKGILDTAFAEVSVENGYVVTEISRMWGDGYYAIYRKNKSYEKVVDFYFNDTGYQAPQGEQGNEWIWSSSVHPDGSYDAYSLRGRDGSFYHSTRAHLAYAVRCVAGVR